MSSHVYSTISLFLKLFMNSSAKITTGIAGVLCLVGFSAYVGSSYQESKFTEYFNEHRYFDAALEVKWNLYFLEKLGQNKHTEVICSLEKLMTTNVSIMDKYSGDNSTTRSHQNFITKTLVTAHVYIDLKEIPNCADDLEETIFDGADYLK